MEGRILYIPVPQSQHVPFIAGRPFFITTSSASFISFLALHLTQYASATSQHPLRFVQIDPGAAVSIVCLTSIWLHLCLILSIPTHKNANTGFFAYGSENRVMRPVFGMIKSGKIPSRPITLIFYHKSVAMNFESFRLSASIPIIFAIAVNLKSYDPT